MAPDAKMFTGAQVTATGSDQWSDCDAAISFRVRTSRLAEGLDGTLLASLLGWFEREWSFDAPVFVTSEPLTQQVATLEAALRRRFELQVPKVASRYLAYDANRAPR